MAYRCLHEFLARLEEMGELHRVTVEVDPVLEIAEITDRMCKSAHGGKALLFERVKGSAFPVATNLFGSYRRVCEALEIGELSRLSRLMEELLPLQPASSGQTIDDLHSPALSRFTPLLANNGDCQSVADYNPDLRKYPLLKSWPGDAGRFITLPLVFTRDPETGTQNCGMYRVRVFDENSAGVHWNPGSGGAGHYGKYQSRRERMPIAIAVGGDPALIWSASLPLPGAVDEMAFAGYIRNEPVSMVRCLTSGIMVPANAEMVIEGYLDPGEARDEGEFGNHTGYYTTGGDVPVVHVTCITHRNWMIYPATVVGPPPMEDCYLAKATERLLLPLSRRQVPAIVDINLPMEGIFHGCAVVAIRKEHAGQARQVVNELWHTGWLRKAKLLIVVDADVPVNDLSLVGWKVVNNAEWPRDLIIADDRMGLDATGKLAEETDGIRRQEIRKDEVICKLVERKWREYGCA